MHAYLVVGKDVKEREKRMALFARKLKAKPIEFALKKIEDTRALNSFLKLSTAAPWVILIKDIDEATPEALNAFLKNLEEPQKNIYFILTAQGRHGLAPTIISRCQIIEVGSSQKESEKKVAFPRKFLKMTEGKKLLFIYSIRERDEAIEFMEKFIVGTHHLLVTSKLGPLIAYRALKSANHAFQALRANGNVSLQLANFTLNLPEFPL